MERPFDYPGSTQGDNAPAPAFYWWQSGTLYHAQHAGRSEFFTSTDLADALEQAGYREGDTVHASERPEDDVDWDEESERNAEVSFAEPGWEG